MTRNTTKRALVMSMISLILCVSMLAGSTFAWFTDTASTGVNKITSGNLDVKLYYSTDMKTWAEADGATDIFSGSKWEPGYTEVVYFKVENAGSLAVDYKVSTNIVKENTGVNTAGKEFKLSEYLQYGIVETAIAYTDRDSAREAITNPVTFKSVTVAKEGVASKAEATFAMVVWMPEETGNSANHNGVNVPEIQFGVNVIAAQANVETDSFNPDYDETPEYPAEPELVPVWSGKTDDEGLVSGKDDTAKVITITTAEELASFAASVNAGNSYSGYTVNLESDIDLGNKEWTPIGNVLVTNNAYDWNNSTYFAGTFDGKGHTIYNLNVNAPGTNIQGFFGYGKIKEVKNLNFHNASVSGLRRSAVIVGQNDGTMDVSNVNFTGLIKVDVFRNEAGTVVGRGDLGVVSNVNVSADPGSYVKCNVTNNSYFEYVGGVWGHAWPKYAENIKSNIDVYAYASSTGGIGGGCAVNSNNITCTGNVELAIKDADIHKGTIECWQTNGSIYGFGVGSNNVSTHTNCVSTGSLIIAGETMTDLNVANETNGYNVGDVRFGYSYYLNGVITIVD